MAGRPRRKPLQASGSPGAKAEARAIIYGGDREFPPYEYLDDRGTPQGFNLQLMRALAREAGLSLEIRLGLRDKRMAEFDAGKTDAMFLSCSDERGATYQLLDQTWALSQVVMMRPGSSHYLRGLDDLWGVRVAVDDGSINHLLVVALPESRRPTLQVVAARSDVMGDLADEATEVPRAMAFYEKSARAKSRRTWSFRSGARMAARSGSASTSASS